MPKLEADQSVAHAVTQDGIAVIGQAPAVSVGNLYQTIGDSVSKSVINNVFAQQQLNMTSQAASTAGVTNLFSLPV
jgi:hypothetical protein